LRVTPLDPEPAPVGTVVAHDEPQERSFAAVTPEWVDGWRPVRVSFDVEIATNVPSGCGGVGGAPGEGVTVKACP
jgi:hypothetical protein